MLRKSLVGALVLLVAVFACSATLLAQGKAKGLGKSLSKAGGAGKANSALNRAGQNVSRVGGSVNRAGGLGRAGAPGREALGGSTGRGSRGDAAPGEEISPRLADASARHQRQLTIEQTNRDRRIAQAQHLREIAARNGDAELAANADRLEAFANDHYRERALHLSRFGVTDPNLPTDPGTGEPPAPQPDPATAPGGEPAIQPAP